MSDEQRNTIWRFAIIFIVITLGFVAVLVKIAYIQTVERDEWLKVAEKQVPTVRFCCCVGQNRLYPDR